MCYTLNLLDQLHKKWILRNVLKHRLYTAYWTMLAATPLSIWTTEAPSKMTASIASVKYFAGGPNASKPVSCFTTKTMRHIRHPPPPKKKNVTLSYPHKIDWRRLTHIMVRLWEVRHLKYTYTVHWQFGDGPSTDSNMRSVSSITAEYICLSTCLSVCESVCLSIKKGYYPLSVTYISYVTALA